MKANVDNQGDARVYPANYVQCLVGGTCQKVKSVTLNDLLPFVPEKECILKLDIQGFEHRAFVQSELLLNSVSIPSIFMEWAMMREHYISQGHKSEDKTMIYNMIQLLVHRGYAVTSLVSGKQLNVNFWHGWPEDVLWTRM